MGLLPSRRGGRSGFERMAGYHGEISIDPSSGAILRFEAEAEIKHYPPLSRSDTMISYGPVEIGGELLLSAEKRFDCADALHHHDGGME